MTKPVSLFEVFVPGKAPQFTYNPRNELNLEEKLTDYLEEGGAILAVSGPTKTGKSVLLRRKLKDPLWIEGHGIEDIHEFWRRLADGLGLYTSIGYSSGTSNSNEDTFGGSIGGGRSVP